MVYNKLNNNRTLSVNTMIDILDCDLKSMGYLTEEDLDTVVSFDYCGDKPDFLCTLGDIKYTYKFCRKLLEMCRDAGYID